MGMGVPGTDQLIPKAFHFSHMSGETVTLAWSAGGEAPIRRRIGQIDGDW